MPGRLASLFARPPHPMHGDPPPPEGDGAEPEPPPSPPPPRPVSPQRERRWLTRQREIELRDVGGLAVEMARRDDWRYPLLHSRCAEVLAMEERIHELDSMIAASEIAARGVGAQPCVCGAPILRGSHFCSHCGRPASDMPPVVACNHCGQPLPADVNFCPVCGHAVAAEAFEAAAGPAEVDDTFVAPVPTREEQAGGS